MDYQMHTAAVLVGAFQQRDVGVPSKMVHNLHFPLHVLYIFRCPACWQATISNSECRNCLQLQLGAYIVTVLGLSCIEHWHGYETCSCQQQSSSTYEIHSTKMEELS